MTGVALIGNGCPKHDQLKPGDIQDLTHSWVKDLTCGDRGVP